LIPAPIEAASSESVKIEDAIVLVEESEQIVEVEDANNGDEIRIQTVQVDATQQQEVEEQEPSEESKPVSPVQVMTRALRTPRKPMETPAKAGLRSAVSVKAAVVKTPAAKPSVRKAEAEVVQAVAKKSVVKAKVASPSPVKK